LTDGHAGAAAGAPVDGEEGEAAAGNIGGDCNDDREEVAVVGGDTVVAFPLPAGKGCGLADRGVAKGPKADAAAGSRASSGHHHSDVIVAAEAAAAETDAVQDEEALVGSSRRCFPRIRTDVGGGSGMGVDVAVALDNDTMPLDCKSRDPAIEVHAHQDAVGVLAAAGTHPLEAEDGGCGEVVGKGRANGTLEAADASCTPGDSAAVAAGSALQGDH